MGESPNSNAPLWLPKKDKSGIVFKSTVAQAAIKNWDRLRNYAARERIDPSFAADILENIVKNMSASWGRAGDSEVRNPGSYIFARFTRRIKRLAARERKIEYVGTLYDIGTPEAAQDWEWPLRIENAMQAEEAIGYMDEPTRRTYLRRMQGFSWKVIAKKQGVNVNTATKSYSRGLARVRERMLSKPKERPVRKRSVADNVSGQSERSLRAACMSNDVISKTEEKRLLELGRQVFSNSFPNPERKGCPGAGVLRAIATGKELGPDEDDWVSHCSRCSPCYRELGEYRRAFIRHRRLRRLSVAAIVIAAICIGTWLAMNRRAGTNTGINIAENVQTQGAIQKAVLDLRAWSAVRSDEATPSPSGKLLELHRGLLALTIYLPMGSQPGNYEIEILRSQGKPLLRLEGTARIVGGNTVLSTRVDLSKLQPSQYSLGIRQPPWEWRYFPFTLR